MTSDSDGKRAYRVRRCIKVRVYIRKKKKNINHHHSITYISYEYLCLHHPYPFFPEL